MNSGACSAESPSAGEAVTVACSARLTRSPSAGSAPVARSSTGFPVRRSSRTTETSWPAGRASETSCAAAARRPWRSGVARSAASPSRRSNSRLMPSLLSFSRESLALLALAGLLLRRLELLLDLVRGVVAVLGQPALEHRDRGLGLAERVECGALLEHG